MKLRVVHSTGEAYASGTRSDLGYYNAYPTKWVGPSLNGLGDFNASSLVGLAIAGGLIYLLFFKKVIE